MRAWASLKVLFMGYGAGIALAAIFTILAISTRIGTDFLETMTAMFNPLPAIALLPLALIWFGLGNGSLVFVLIHSVLWPVALNTHSGFKSVSNTLRMVGRNYGLRGLPYVARILIPAAFGSILTGLKIGWAFAWRTLIAAELVFGVSSGQGGLGWFIFENRNLLDIPAVFAGLLTVIIIGLDRREPDLPHHRAQHRPEMGHPIMTKQEENARPAPQRALVRARRSPRLRPSLARDADGLRAGGVEGPAGDRDPQHLVGRAALPHAFQVAASTTSSAAS